MTEELTVEEQEAYVQKINDEQKDRFALIPFSDRVLFLSHCITKKLKEEIRQYAEELGYKVHVVGGGSIVYKIMKREKPKAVAGIACIPELEMAVAKTKLPLCIIRLDTDGCKDTSVDLEKVKKALSVMVNNDK